MRTRAWLGGAALSFLCACSVYDDSLLSDAVSDDEASGPSGGASPGPGNNAGSGGASPGSGGLANTGGGESEPCVPGTTTPRAGASLLDDFDDNDKWIASVDGRTGRWSTDNDGTAGSQVPNGLAWESLPMSERQGEPGNLALHYQGHDFSSWHLVLAELADGGAHDLSAFSGISLWVRTDCTSGQQAQLRIALSDAESFASAGAVDHAGFAVPFALSGEWRELTIPFSGLRRRFGSISAFEASTAHALIVSPNAPGALDVWLDDIVFYAD